MSADANPAPGADEAVRVDVERLTDFGAAVLRAAGLTDEDARTVVRMLVGADVRGVHTHGIRYLPIYLPLLRGGAIRPDARPRVIRETAGSAVIDADAGMGPVAADLAARTAIQKARDNGFGATVLIRNSNHFGANGSYALLCAEAGMIGIVMSNSVPVMGAPGAAGKVISNSPVAYAIPAGRGRPPILLDIALSMTAASRILMAAARGTQMDEPVIVQADGTLTRDPAAYLAGGALAPLGAHKGYGLAVLVETLAGVLSGAGILGEVLQYRFHPSTPSNTGHAIIAINPEAFMEREEFEARIGRLADEIHAAPPIPGARPLLPGEPEAAHAADTERHGLELDAVTWSELEAVARELSLEAALDAAFPADREGHAG